MPRPESRQRFLAMTFEKNFIVLTHTQNLHLLQQSFKIFGHVHILWYILYLFTQLVLSIWIMYRARGRAEGRGTNRLQLICLARGPCVWMRST